MENVIIVRTDLKGGTSEVAHEVSKNFRDVGRAEVTENLTKLGEIAFRD